MFKREGMFLKQLPQQVQLLEPPPDYIYFDMPIRKAVQRCLLEGRLGLAIARIRALGGLALDGAGVEVLPWLALALLAVAAVIAATARAAFRPVGSGA